MKKVNFKTLWICSTERTSDLFAQSCDASQSMTLNVVMFIIPVYLFRYLCPDSCSFSTSQKHIKSRAHRRILILYHRTSIANGHLYAPHGISKGRPMIIDKTIHITNTSLRHRLICTMHLLNVTFNFFVVFVFVNGPSSACVRAFSGFSSMRSPTIFSEPLRVRWTWIRSELEERNWMNNFERFWLLNDF